MSWNNGYERKKFEQAQKAQAKEYRKCGMSEEQIQAVYLQDLQEYRNNRIYAIHIQSIEELESDGEESRNALHKKFLLSMTCTMDISECGRYGWIDAMENTALYSVKLLELRERLKEYTGFDYSVIPESIVEAFIERIWVSKDEFRWYLRTGNKAEGEFDPDDHIKIGSFTLTIDDAKKYIYSFSTRRRVYKWVDLNVSVWI